MYLVAKTKYHYRSRDYQIQAINNCHRLSRIINKLAEKFETQDNNSEAQNETAKTLALLAREWRGQAAELRNVVEGRAAAQLALKAPMIEIPSPYYVQNDVEFGEEKRVEQVGEVAGSEQGVLNDLGRPLPKGDTMG